MKKILEYIFTLLLILTTNSIYMVTGNYSDYIRIFFTIVLGLLIIVNLSSEKNKKSKKSKSAKTFIFLLFYYFFIILFTLITDTEISLDYLHIYFFTFPMLYYLFAIINSDDCINLLSKFSKVVYILCILSLFFFIFGTTLKIINPSSSIIINWGTVQKVPSYFGLHFNVQTIEIFGKTFIRNTGVFSEAPMFSLNIIIALAIEFFIKKEISKKNIIIFIITILTTASTTGLILCAFIIFIYYLLKKDSKFFGKKIKFILIIIFSIISIFFISNLIIDKQKTASYYARVDDYVASYNAWKENPIFGNGYKNSDVIIKYMGSFRKNNTGLSNSILVLLAQCGIYMSIFYFIPAIKAIKFGIKNKNKNIIAFDIILILLFCTTIFLYKPLIFYFLAIGYNLDNKAKKEI